MRIPFNACIFLTLIFSSFIPCTRVLGCGNEYEEVVTSDGNTKEISEGMYYIFHDFNIDQLKDRRQELEKQLKNKYSFEKDSDYALVLLKLGEHKKSLAILRRLIKKYPNEYNVVANLGTAYELNGKDDSALYYIEKAVKINPQSHEGSEWIHVKILEAKLAMKKNPDLLKTETILGMDVDPRGYYNNEEVEKLRKVKDQLFWQLKERIAFVKPPDPVVADLLFTMANMVAITDYLEASLPLYNLSIKYKPQDLDQVEYMRNYVEHLVRHPKNRGSYYKYFFLLFAAISIVVFILRKRKRTKKAVNVCKKEMNRNDN